MKPMTSHLANLIGVSPSAVAVDWKETPQEGVTYTDINPTQGDSLFFTYCIPGAIFLAKDGSYWILEHITENGLCRVRNQWYPRQERTMSMDILRNVIYAWTDPSWIVVPPLAEKSKK